MLHRQQAKLDKQDYNEQNFCVHQRTHNQQSEKSNLLSGKIIYLIKG